MNQGSVDKIGKLGDWIILCMSILISIQFFVELIHWGIRLTPDSFHSVLSFGLCMTIYWGFYLLHRSQMLQRMFSEHITAFCCLTLFVFISLYKFTDFSQFSIFFLIYPIIISLFRKHYVFLIWGTLSYLLYGLFLFFDPTFSLFNEEEVSFFASKILPALGSLLICLIIRKYIAAIRYKFKEEYEVKSREHIVRLLHTLIPIVERKSRRANGEIEQMTLLIKKIMDQFPEDQIYEWEIQLISLLHYVSRIKWPDYIFEKQDKLTEFEYRIIQEHSFIGHDFLQGYPGFERVVQVILYHHERLDGTGYPHQVKGKSIPRAAQALGIVESFIAMTTSRSYQNALTAEQALMEIEAIAGIAYEQEVVQALKAVVELQKEIGEEAPYLVG